VALETGEVRRSAALPPEHFGEGSTGWGDEIVSLTWHGGTGFRWRRSDLGPLGSFRYKGEGWGLTHDGASLIMSDGTAELRFLDPKSFAERRRIRVTAAGSEVTDLNELEYVDGEILANIWRQSLIARIDPATGRVIGWISCGAIVASIGATDPDSVLNGIAWDAKARKLYVTGKRWPRMFEIALPPKPRP
jgi:glutaminyl-peptide cyclotransferase